MQADDPPRPYKISPDFNSRGLHWLRHEGRGYKNAFIREWLPDIARLAGVLPRPKFRRLVGYPYGYWSYRPKGDHGIRVIFHSNQDDKVIRVLLVGHVSRVFEDFDRMMGR